MKSIAILTQYRDDRGIVYYPAHPYGICIMTEGKDLAQLENVIARLSQTAYASVNGGLLAQWVDTRGTRPALRRIGKLGCFGTMGKRSILFALKQWDIWSKK